MAIRTQITQDGYLLDSGAYHI